jgi:hypothetical protein
VDAAHTRAQAIVRTPKTGKPQVELMALSEAWLREGDVSGADVRLSEGAHATNTSAESPLQRVIAVRCLRVTYAGSAKRPKDSTRPMR